MRLPPEYSTVYDNMLLGLADYKLRLDLGVSLFWPACGLNYDGRLMVVGRAINSDEGDSDCKLALFNSAEVRTQQISELRIDEDKWTGIESVGEGQYSTNRSAFWRVGKKIAASVGIESSDWSSYLCWSNLFKVSPSPGMNPNDAFQEAQLQFAIRFLQIELDTYRPSTVVFLTGSDWSSSFSSALGMNLRLLEGNRFIQEIGMYRSSRVVVGVHPMTRPEDLYLEEFYQAVKGDQLAHAR